MSIYTSLAMVLMELQILL